MRDALAASVVAMGDDPEIRGILLEICRVTGMGFAAVAHVTEERWIAAQVIDRIEFGLDSGQELEIKKTICDDIRKCGHPIVIDHIAADPAWRTHPVPMLYGFESYASFPVYLEDGTFFGTLCAIDPEPRALTAPDTIAILESFARRVGSLLSARVRSAGVDP